MERKKKIKRKSNPTFLLPGKLAAWPARNRLGQRGQDFKNAKLQ